MLHKSQEYMSIVLSIPYTYYIEVAILRKSIILVTAAIFDGEQSYRKLPNLVKLSKWF